MHYALAAGVMAVFVLGLGAITIVRRINASFDVWRPRSETALRASDPSRKQFDGVVAALLSFADAVAEEILLAVWKPRPQ